MGCRPSKVKPQDVIDPSKTKYKNLGDVEDQLEQEHFEEEIEDINEFPDPNTIEILDFTPPDKGDIKIYKIEDSFWEGKKKLIPDYATLLKVDQHALKAPKDLKYNPDGLVQYLLKGANTEIERIRVLVRWIGDNIAYDVQGRDQGNADCSFEGVLRSGKAICEGYAVVVSMFCQKANIECRKIAGQTKNGEFLKEIRVKPKSDHAWNQVKIDGEWYFIDSTWCAGSVGSEFTKQWDEGWFIVDPKAFIFTHLPMTSDDQIASDLQAISKPYTSSQVWDEMVYQSPLGCAFGFETISFAKKDLKTKESKLSIKYKYSTKLKLNHYVIITNEASGIKLDSEWKMVFEKNGVVTSNVRFPGKGVYQIDVMVKLKFEDHTDETLITCFQYRVVNTGGKMNPFPGPYGWGETEDFTGAGFRIANPVSPISTAENGVAKVRIKMPSNGIVPNTFTFVKPDLKNKKEISLNDHVYAEKKGKFATYYIQCPSSGEYRFTLYIKVREGQPNFSSVAYVLVISSSNKAAAFLQPNGINAVLGGPKPKFYKLGFTTNRKSSTIHFEGDKTVLHIKKTNGSYLRAKLLSASDPNANSLLEKDENDQQCIITVNKPKVPGFYWIQLYGGQDEYGSMQGIGTYCVPYMIPFLKK